HPTPRSFAAALAASLIAALTCSSAGAQTSPAPAPAMSAGPAMQGQPATSITAETLAGAQQNPNDWLTYGRDLGAQRFSPLTQIDASNVKRLTVAWSKRLGPPISMEG